MSENTCVLIPLLISIKGKYNIRCGKTSQTYLTATLIFHGAFDIFVHGSKIDLGIVLYMLIKLIYKEIEMSQLILS